MHAFWYQLSMLLPVTHSLASETLISITNSNCSNIENFNSKLIVDVPSRAQAMHAFRDNESTLLLATPAASRGLDLPAVGFVYSLGAPADATDYLHRAGRAGRIGSPVDGE